MLLACALRRYPLRATAPDADGRPPSAPVEPSAVAKHLTDLIAETRHESAEMFGESADNITAVCVAFDTIEPTEPHE